MPAGSLHTLTASWNGSGGVSSSLDRPEPSRGLFAGVSKTRGKAMVPNFRDQQGF